MSFWIKALPYFVAIGGGLIGAVKWLYGALTEERNYYREKFLEEENKIGKLQSDLVNLKSKNKELQWTIDDLKKELNQNETKH